MTLSNSRLRTRASRALGQGDRKRAPAALAAPFRVPIRGLALATGLACLVAQVLSHTGGSGGATRGPWGLVVGQAVWNAAQVGLLLLLLGLWSVRRRGSVVGLAVATLVCLPFAIYALSPGAWALTAIAMTTCAFAWLAHPPDLGLAMVEAPVRAGSMLAKFEFLALACNLLSSTYNFDVSRGTWPHWAAIFEKTSTALGLRPGSEAIAHALYTLGLPGVSLPPYIRPPYGDPVGAVVFILVWTVLPALYVLFFAACAKMAENTHGKRLQQALCLFAIFHFLFLTDLVDYAFGRGLVNPAAEWCHWSERLVWRIAILLPIYQNLVSGRWRRGDGVAGVVLHYGLAVWAAVFLVYQVLICDGGNFYTFLTGREVSYGRLVTAPYNLLGYPAALVLMTLLYGVMLLAVRCKRVEAEPLSP